MRYPKQKKTFWLFSQNINVLKLDEKGGDLIPISEFLNIYQCDMAGLSEINLDVSKYKVRKILTDTLNRSFDANQFSASTSDIPFESQYKPGGTITAVFNNDGTMEHDFADRKTQKNSPLYHRLPIGRQGNIRPIHCLPTTDSIAETGRQDHHPKESLY